MTFYITIFHRSVDPMHKVGLHCEIPQPYFTSEQPQRRSYATECTVRSWLTYENRKKQSSDLADLRRWRPASLCTRSLLNTYSYKGWPKKVSRYQMNRNKACQWCYECQWIKVWIHYNIISWC